MRLRRQRTLHFREVEQLPPDGEEMRVFDLEQDVYALLEAVEGRLCGRNVDDGLAGDGLTFTTPTESTPKKLQLDPTYSPTFDGITATTLALGDWVLGLDATDDFKLEFRYEGSTILQVWDDQVVFNADLRRESGTTPNIGEASLPFGSAFFNGAFTHTGSTFGVLGATPVVQQDRPTTLSEVIDALEAYGFWPA